MATCEHYHELFLDHLYGLLEPAEAQDLSAHVETCAACRAALADAQRQQQLLARAARVVQDVPVFAPPGYEAEVPATLPLSSESITPDAAAETIPLSAASTISDTPEPAPSSRRRVLLRRYWPAWAAAAGLLVAAIGLNAFYRSGLATYQAEVNQTKKGADAIDSEFAALRANLETSKKDQARQLAGKLPTQMTVSAPATALVDTKLPVNILLRDRNGQPRSGEVTIEGIDPNRKDQPLVTAKKRIDGIGTVECLVKAGVQEIVVKVKDDLGQVARLEEKIDVVQPTHSSHLALNKSVYVVGEVLFFRSLTLDSYTLKPPTHPLQLRFLLQDNAGRAVKELAGATGPGGISGGELALTNDLPSGNYTLQVRAADGSADVVLPQARNIDILREDTPQIALNRTLFKAGETVTYEYRGGAKAADKDINIGLQADGKDVPQPAAKGAAQLQKRTDKNGNSRGVLQLPPVVKESVQIVVTMDGKNNTRDAKGDQKKLETAKGDAAKTDPAKSAPARSEQKNDAQLVQDVPVVPSHKLIDFFPEGGDLVAGVANRVYYRVKAPNGDPVAPEGHVIVLSDSDVLYDSDLEQAHGSFTFTPDLKENYSVRITGPEGVTEIDQPFAKFLKAEGIVLSAAQPVSREGDPLTVVVRNQGVKKQLFLQATCRGQIVAQQYLDMAPGNREVKLEPVSGASGILRVTVFDASQGRFVPVAERLLYRVPSHRLDIANTIVNGPGPYQAGTNIKMNFKALDENKNGDPVWYLAYVGDEQFRAEKKERSLAAHFYLAGEFGSDDLDNANLVLNDTPASWKALEMFLGTQGWRRFVGGDNVMLAREQRRAGGDVADRQANQAAPASVAFFTRQSATPAKAQEDYRAALQREVGELIDKANQQRADLQERRDIASVHLSQAIRALADYEQLPREYLRLGLGILTLVLLTAGAVFIAVGLVRLARQREESPTGCFAGAFSCLFACLVLYLVGGRMPQADVTTPLAAASGKQADWPRLDAEHARRPETEKVPAAPALPDGVFYAQAVAVPLPDKQKATAALPVPINPQENAAQHTVQNQSQNSVRLDTTNSRNPNYAPYLANSNIDVPQQQQIYGYLRNNKEMNDRFQNAEQLAKSQRLMQPQVAPPQTVPTQPQPAPGGSTNPGGSAKKKDEPKGMADKLPATKTPVAAKGAASGGGYGSMTGPEAAKSLTEGWNYHRMFDAYVHRGLRQRGVLDFQDTLVWHPALFSADGNAWLSFDLSQNATTYRILLFANSPSGRLGFYEGHLEVRPSENNDALRGGPVPEKK